MDLTIDDLDENYVFNILLLIVKTEDEHRNREYTAKFFAAEFPSFNEKEVYKTLHVLIRDGYLKGKQGHYPELAGARQVVYHTTEKGRRLWDRIS